VAHELRWSRAETRAIKGVRRKQAKIAQVLTLMLPTRHASVSQKTEHVWMRLGIGGCAAGSSAKNAFNAMDCNGATQRKAFVTAY